MKGRILKWKIGIAALFLVCLLTYIVLATLVAAWGVVNPDSRIRLFTQMLSIYATPLGTILGGTLVSRQRKVEKGQNLEFWQLAIVVILALLWNGLIVGRFALFTFDVFTDDTFTQVTAFQDAVTGLSGIPIATGLAFAFSSNGTD